jgi:Regulator of cell morphogenesis and NO signaling
MAQEEDDLFPVCRDAGAGVATSIGDDLLRELEHTDQATGTAFAELREQCGDYATDGAHGSTHRLLLKSLAAMEADLHQHIHEENNLLFPRLRELLIVRA